MHSLCTESTSSAVEVKWEVVFNNEKAQLVISNKSKQSWEPLMEALVKKWPRLQNVDFTLQDSRQKDVDEVRAQSRLLCAMLGFVLRVRMHAL